MNHTLLLEPTLVAHWTQPVLRCPRCLAPIVRPVTLVALRDGTVACVHAGRS